MRAIKKTVKTTIVEVYQPDVENMKFEYLGTIEFDGGLGERFGY